MPHKLRIHHIDVGQGDATLIVLKNDEVIEHAVLIDAGSGKMTGERVFNYCRRKLRSKDGLRDEKRLDTIIMSHFDRDHINGLPTIIDSDLVDDETEIVSPMRSASKNNPSGYKRVLNAIQRKYDLDDLAAARARIIELNPTDQKDVGPLSIYCSAANMLVAGEEIEEVHGPEGSHDPDYSGNRANQISLAFVMSMGGFHYYTGGDIGQEQEKAIAAQLGDYPLSAFKFSHHGSHSSTPAELLDVLHEPSVGIISYGHSRHKHPTSAVLDRALESERLKRIYLTGQLSQYSMPREVGGEVPAPGNVVLRQTPGGFNISYDRFDKTEDRGGGEIRLDWSIPENAFYEIILSFIQHDLNVGNANLRVNEGKAFTLSQRIAAAYNDDTVAIEEWGWQANFNEIFDTHADADIDDMIARCHMRYTNINTVFSFERKTRQIIELEAGPQYINKMTDMFHSPDAGYEL